MNRYHALLLPLAILSSQPLLAGQNNSAPAIAEEASDSPTVDFTDSAAAGLAGNKRVVISNVVVRLQTATAFTNANNFLRGKAVATSANADAIMRLEELDTESYGLIANKLYRQLAADLTAAGFEVVPEEQLTSNAAYKAMIAKFGIAQATHQANKNGDEVVFGPTALGLYLPWYGEVGTFDTESNYLIGKKPGFGAAMKNGDAWRLGDSEHQIAKDLNANVVKATYVVTFGAVTGIKLSASVGMVTETKNLFSTTKSYDQTTTAKNLDGSLLLGLLPDQTRIAFRTLNGPRFQKRSMLHYEPAKDGEVVLRVTNKLAAPGNYFELGQGQLIENQAKANNAEAGRKKMFGGLINNAKLAVGVGSVTSTALYPVSISDPTAYAVAFTGVAKKANQAMLGLVKQ